MKRRLLILGLVLVLGLSNQALAGKKGGGGGGEGDGGGGDPEPSGPLVVELDTNSGLVRDINELDRGSVEVVGSVYNPESSTAMYWKVHVDEAGTPQVDSVPLSKAAPTGSVAERTKAAGINNHGEIVGCGWEILDETAYPQPMHYWPLLWSDENAQAVVLPVPKTEEGVRWCGRATSINNDGIVLGVVWQPAEPYQAAVYSLIAWKVNVQLAEPVEDWITFLPATSVLYYLESSPSPKIAQSGLAVTSLEDYYPSLEDWRVDAYRFQVQFDGQDLSVVSGTIEPLFSDPSVLSSALGINDVGTVAGFLYDPTEAFVMDAAGDLVSLETLPSERIKGIVVWYDADRAQAINNLGISVGTIAGWMTDSRGLDRWHHDEAAMWDADGALTILPNWQWSSDINDDGWIGGSTLNRTPGVLIP